MQIKTQMKYDLTLLRIAIIKKCKNNKCWGGCEEKGTFLHCAWGCKLAQPLRKTEWSLLKILKIDLPYDPATQLLAIYPDNRLIQEGT